MKWAVVGSLGMLGKDLVFLLSEKGEQVEGFHRGNLDFSLDLLDLAPRFAGFDVIVNCVAYTKVDQAEVERDEAFFANAYVPSLLAGIADSVGAKLIHVSTNYVFDGNSKSPYETDGIRRPQSIYGKTKSIGEDLVLAFRNSKVVRTSWLYGAQGNCFPKTIAKKLLAGDSFRVIDDQISSPTHTKALAEFIRQLGKSDAGDAIWHGVSSGSTSWFGFATEIEFSLRELSRSGLLKREFESRMANSQITKCTTLEEPLPAVRPLHSILVPSKINDYSIPDWKSCWKFSAREILGAFFQ